MKTIYSTLQRVGMLIFGYAAMFGLSGCTTDDVDDVPAGADSYITALDFTSPTELTAWGLAIPANGSGTNVTSVTKEGVSIDVENAAGANPVRIWATNSGVLDLRIYTGDKLTISVPDGYVITSLSWTSANADNIDQWTANVGSVSGGQWIIPDNGKYSSVTLTATATTRINVLTVAYEQGAADEPEPQPATGASEEVDFTSSEALTALGIAIPENGSGTEITSLTQGLATINAVNATGANPVRIWATNSGVLDLRIYENDALYITVPDGYIITSISWTSAKADALDLWTSESGTIANGTWTPNEGETYAGVTLVATGTARINVLTVNYEEGQANATDEPAQQDPATLAGDRIFDFTSASALEALGIAIPANGAGTNLASATIDFATITATNADGANPARVWATNSGVLDLRVYNGDKLTFSVPDGYVITGLSWTTANSSSIDLWSVQSGSISNGVWTAPEGKTYQSLTLTATGTARINVLTFSYAPGQANATDEPAQQAEQHVDVSFDFTSSSAIEGWGFAVPANGAGTNMDQAISQENFTITPTNSGSTAVRFFATNSGVLDLRVYKDDVLTYSVPDGYYISALSWTSANAGSIDSYTPSAGTLENGVWTAPSGQYLSSVSFTATATTRINVLSATYAPKP